MEFDSDVGFVAQFLMHRIGTLCSMHGLNLCESHKC